MKLLFKLILLSAASTIIPILAAFQPGRAQDVKSEYLTDADGLSQNAVLCILQDPPGLMWFVALCALMLVLAVYAGYRCRLQRLKAREDELEQMVMARTEQLRESEELFRMLYNNTPVMMHSINKNGEIVNVNDYWLKVMGYQREEVLGKKSVDFVTAASREYAENVNIPQFFKTGCLENIEYQWVKKSGEIIDVLLSSVGIRDERGDVERSLAFIVDITERKRAEQALRESEARYRSLVEQMPDGLYRSTPDGKFIEVNPALVRMFGYDSKEELLSIDIPRQLYFEPSDRENAIALVKQKGNQAIVQVRHRRKDGQEVWSEVHARLICDDNGNVVRHEGILRDITERKRLEEQLRLHTENLENLVAARTAQIRELEKQRLETEKLAAIGRMAARIAHEVNNPLGSIQTAFRLISRAVPTAHRHHHYVGKIEKEIERISRIMRQMLELHKPHAETPTAFRPDVTIEEILTLLKPQLLARHVEFKPDVERARRMITLPENMLRQILYNVILNAQEASPPNGQVFITAQTAEQNLEITVADQGEGIPEEIKTQIFEPFFTTKSNGNSGGMGLGLSICKSLVEAMNGAITFDSKPGEGTICRITIPLNQSKSFEHGEKP
jgi:PAS domain S-box-containing protein